MLQPKPRIPYRPGSVPWRGSRLPLKPPQPPEAPSVKRLTGRAEVSPFTERLLALLWRAELIKISRARAADALFVSETTLGRRLREDGLSFGVLLDRVRFHRCQELLAKGWCRGPAVARELGFREVNSFYRAFRAWTGAGYRASTGPQRRSGDPIDLPSHPTTEDMSHATI